MGYSLRGREESDMTANSFSLSPALAGGFFTTEPPGTPRL